MSFLILYEFLILYVIFMITKKGILYHKRLRSVCDVLTFSSRVHSQV